MAKTVISVHIIIATAHWVPTVSTLLPVMLLFEIMQYRCARCLTFLSNFSNLRLLTKTLISSFWRYISWDAEAPKSLLRRTCRVTWVIRFQVSYYRRARRNNAKPDLNKRFKCFVWKTSHTLSTWLLWNAQMVLLIKVFDVLNLVFIRNIKFIFKFFWRDNMVLNQQTYFQIC
jgi:hypothetical protein